MSLLFAKGAHSSGLPKHPPRPTLCPESCQIGLLLPQLPTPSSCEPDHPMLFAEAPPPRCVPSVAMGEGWPFLYLRSLSKLGWMRLASELTTANSLSVLGATSPGNLMMGDGAAVARPNRQPRTQSARRGPASGPRATRASVIALPGPARRPGGGWLGACGRVAAWLAPAPPRSAAPPGAVRLGLLGFARLSGAWSGPQPSPPPPALAGPGKAFVYLKPQMRSSSHRRRKSGCSGNKGGQPPDVAGWAGRALAVRRRVEGERSGPPLSAPFSLSPSSSFLLSFPFSASFPLSQSFGPLREPSVRRPSNLYSPVRAQNLWNLCWETSGATTLDT